MWGAETPAPMREVPTVLLVIGILALAAVPAALALWLFN